MDQATDTPPVAEAPSQSAPENAASLTSAENEERPRPTKPSALRGEGARAGGGQGRRPKACVECKKLKVRCQVFPGDRKCRYCLKRNVDCIINRTYLAHIQDDWDKNGDESIRHDGDRIDAMRKEIQEMRKSLEAVLTKCSQQEEQLAAAQARQPVNQSELLMSADAENATPGSSSLVLTREDNTQMAMTRENSAEPAASGDGNEPVTLEDPMGSLYEVTRLRNIRSNKAKTTRPSPNKGEVDDFISRGVISEQEADKLYNIFHNTLNHYLWIGLEQIHPSFISVRQSSELLAATILTVTALHIPTSSSTFDACYKEFLSLISSSMFSRYHSVDDVRGLCIAAFWLSEVSWKLSGHAIRIATELNIHQSFSRALTGDREHFLKARLWYMLYVCDHHFSIAYGRPPMVSETTQIREHERFFASPLADVLDARILSQVSLMQILTRVYDRFTEGRLPELDDVRSGRSSGAMYGNVASGNASADNRSSAAMLAESDFEILSAYNLEIDQWRMRWYPRQPPSPYIGEFPRRGVVLYSYFAKLQINSLAVRGVSASSGRLSTERKEFANMAVSAAVSILTLLLDEDDMRKALVGTPLYVHTMIAFASVFLVNATTKWDRLIGLNIEPTLVTRLLEGMVVVLKSAATSDRHMLKHIAVGLEKMLGRLAAVHGTTAASSEDRNGFEGQAGPAGPVGPGWHLESGDQSGMGFRDDFGSQPSSTLATGSLHDQIGNMQGSGSGNLHPQHATGDSEEGMGFFGDGSAVLNDHFLYQTFGTGSAGDVYNLLSAHYQY